MPKFVYWFSEIGKEDGNLVGGKGANLGEMTKFNIPVPPGFVVSAQAYYYFIEKSGLSDKIRTILKNTDRDKPETYEPASEKIKALILDQPVPQEISTPVIRAYLKLGGLFRNPLVAVRSSATAEDLPEASFAGQQSTFLNVKGETELIDKLKEAWASLYEARAIFYRDEQKYDHFKVALASPVQIMIQSKASGIMFTADPVGRAKNRIVIEAVYGLGEFIVQGMVTPDHYVVNKDSFDIIDKVIEKQSVYLAKKGKETFSQKVKPALQNKQKISDALIVKLAKLGAKIHQHYFFPQDIEWAIDSKDRVYIVQTRPITTLTNAIDETKEDALISQKALKLTEQKTVLLTGSPASPGIGWGPAIIINSKKEISKVKQGDILVTEMTTPDFVPAMKKVSGIVTDRGGQTSHAAIVSRELGVPCVVGTDKATKTIKDGQSITVDGSSGTVYRGGLNLDQQIIKPIVDYSVSPDKPIITATKVYVNLAEKSLAEPVAQKAVDGVGLLRAEFMIADIGVHPKKLIADHKQKLFVDKLTDGLADFCRSFNPRPVVYRATDFKTNEYRNLKGGDLYEPEESNPMLGYRGAYRYIVDEPVFELELKAIHTVRNKLGLKNLWLMIPFVHTPDEMIKVKKIIAANDLMRSPSFKLWMMVEIPSNVILLEDFIKTGIDGVSIGSNDLTMLTLGIDRDNQEVAPAFDERNPAVLWMLEKTITTCRKNKITCSICGQAPSEYPDLVQKLVDFGITSISVNPDAIERTRELIYQAESKKVSKSG